MDRRIYLDYLPLETLLDTWQVELDKQGFNKTTATEQIAVCDSLNRVTVEPIFAPCSSPAFHASAVDGIAVKAEDTYGAAETAPKSLAGTSQAFMIDTGDPVPEGFNAVIMIEDVNETEAGAYEIIKPAVPWENIRPLGEDMVASELILPRGHLIKPEDIGAMLASGLDVINVRKRPIIGIIPTGTELAEKPKDLQPGQVIESNSWVLRANVVKWGGEPRRWPLLIDDYDMIKQAVVEAVVQCDAVVINAGTSAGREDFSASIIEELGTLVAHGGAIRPGRTVILGAVNGKPVMGFAGFPVANYLHTTLFLKKVIFSLLGTHISGEVEINARLARKLVSPLGVRETIQVRVAEINGSFLASPLPRGSGVTMSLVRSDGEIIIPAESEGLHRGVDVRVALKSDVNMIRNNILAVGSHDMVLDILDDELKRVFPELSLASTNAGSTGGLIAAKEGITHIAGTHLLDPETGFYNVSFIDKLLADLPIKLVTLAHRTQGLIVKPGNPKKIQGLADLARKDISFINRQRDSGTRILLDYLLGKISINCADIYGYQREVYTHTAVAAAVKSGSADAGLGVWAAAVALGLDFIPLEEERYDLLMRTEFYESDKGRKLLQTINRDGFKQRLENMCGYSARETGRIVI